MKPLFIVIFLFSCLNASKQNRFYRRATSVTNVTSSYSTLDSPATFSLWATIARKIRFSLRGGGYAYFPLTNTTGNNIPAQSELTAYYLPVAIYLGIIILLIPITLISSCCFCCCLRSRAERIDLPVYTTKSKMIAWAFLLLFFVFFGVGAITSYLGSVYMTTNLNNFKTVGDAFFTDTTKFLGKIDPATVSAFQIVLNGTNQINGVINSTIQISSINNAIVPNNALLVSILNGMYLNVSATNLLLANMGISLQNVQKLSASITAIITYSNSILSSLGNSSSTSTIAASGTTYYVNNPQFPTTNYSPITNANLLTDISNIPNSTSVLNSLQGTPDISAYATNVTNSILNASTVIYNQVQAGWGLILPNLVTSIGRAQTALTNATNTLTQSQIVNNTMTKFDEIMNKATDYDRYRNIFTIILASFVIIIPFGISISAYAKKPKHLRGCSFSTIPLTIFFLILGAVLLLVSVVMGDICSVFFSGNPVPITAYNSGLSGNMNNLYIGLNECINQKSIPQIAGDLNFVNPSQVSISYQVSNEVDNLDFSAITSKLDATTVLVCNSPAVQFNSLNSADTSSWNMTSLSDISTQLTNLRTSVNSLISLVDAANTNALLTWFTAVTGTSVIALSDYKAKLTDISTKLNTLTVSGGLIDQLNSNSTYLNNNATVSMSNVAAIKSNVTAFSNIYAAELTSISGFISSVSTNLTTLTVPGIKTVLDNAAIAADIVFNAALLCSDFALDYQNMDDVVCKGVLTSMDTLWLSYVLLGSSLAIAFILFINMSHALTATIKKTVGLSAMEKFIARQSKLVENKGLTGPQQTMPMDEKQGAVNTNGRITPVNNYE